MKSCRPAPPHLMGEKCKSWFNTYKGERREGGIFIARVTYSRLHLLLTVIRGFARLNKFQKRCNYGSGWVGPGLPRIFFF